MWKNNMNSQRRVVWVLWFSRSRLRVVSNIVFISCLYFAVIPAVLASLHSSVRLLVVIDTYIFVGCP